MCWSEKKKSSIYFNQSSPGLSFLCLDLSVVRSITSSVLRLKRKTYVNIPNGLGFIIIIDKETSDLHLFIWETGLLWSATCHIFLLVLSLRFYQLIYRVTCFMCFHMFVSSYGCCTHTCNLVVVCVFSLLLTIIMNKY